MAQFGKQLFGVVVVSGYAFVVSWVLSNLIHESVDLLGFLLEIEKYEKNNHRHIVDIPRIIFLHSEDIGQKGSKSTGSFME